LRRQSEHDMNVTRGEKFATTCCEPPFPSAGLTLWTMAIATTVVGDGGTLSTAGALIDMGEVCQFFCVNGPVLFLGMGARGKGQRPFPRPAM
jgi:hypothetical protein